ncbi:error-prone DNA polymerase [Pelagibius litoralis]|uniref:Error-prone DNA polymerase n=1 Tax=Pelagibius litoralis TaxID=374515 RepID=A0A967EZ55_9PROT|nr:error-prone DNA polymerase [Pelagibius litoralis]NIA70082.1 error-prone DNA polymerase [Pelagibius litoralis]
MTHTPVQAYVPLEVTSNYSFLRSGSHPEELVMGAAALGLPAVAIADRNSLAGVVRAHMAAKEAGIQLLVGARLIPTDGPEVLCFPADRSAYGRLCRLLTLGKRRAEKGACLFSFDEIIDHGAGQTFVVLPGDEGAGDDIETDLGRLAEACPGQVFLGARALYQGSDARDLKALAALAQRSGVPLAACNDVCLHMAARKPLLDVVTCIREHCTIDTAGYRLQANAERCLKTPEDMAHLFRRTPEALANTLVIAKRCSFSLDELRHDYPEELTREGRSPQQELEHLAWLGAADRYPDGIPEKVRKAVAHELALIARLDYAPYFLTVEDVVRFARSQDILCQGRGSAANSAVCYCLGITEVDPAHMDLLFERFVSAERREPPDIDVDFEHERREEVMQYIYNKYGRERTALTATVICYRSRGAMREVGKVMGLSADTITALAGAIWGWSQEGVEDKEVRALGLDPTDRRLGQTLALVHEVIGFPRHLSQHVGGFVMTQTPLCEVVPIENAAMENRTVIEWDKDDLDALGILKVDVLALGMLTCLRKGFVLIRDHYGPDFTLASVPQDDPEVYAMLSRADTIGVFQVESRAQMSMLPRLKPKTFYDLVIEVAIVRPGPIQGDMVHPYLRRREGREKVDYPSEALRRVLEKTLGVPLFQEQAMQIAIVAAGFAPAEADRLRRAMATFRHVGTIHSFRQKFIDGMVARNYDPAFAERCFNQIEGFGDYGFPESHAASFALLVYVSAWMKHYYPAVFAAALLNSQPMGFYAPAQIVRDAREHGVEIRAPDVNASAWDCTLEPAADGEGFALRLGLRQVKGLGEAEAEAIVSHRGIGYTDPLALWRRASLRPLTLEALARADAYRSMGLARREALWAVKRLPGERRRAEQLPLFAFGEDRETPPEELGTEPAVTLPAMALSEHVVDDYRALRLSLKAHPLAFLRDQLAAEGMVEMMRLPDLPVDKTVTVAGLVLVRQRPGSAKGVIFATLEDETGTANAIVWPDVFQRHRATVMKAGLLAVRGKLQREGLVIHVVADDLIDLTPRLLDLKPGPALQPGPLKSSRARADEVDRPTRDHRPAQYETATARHPRNVNPMPKSRDFH